MLGDLRRTFSRRTRELHFIRPTDRSWDEPACRWNRPTTGSKTLPLRLARMRGGATPCKGSNFRRLSVCNRAGIGLQLPEVRIAGRTAGIAATAIKAHYSAVSGSATARWGEFAPWATAHEVQNHAVELRNASVGGLRPAWLERKSDTLFRRLVVKTPRVCAETLPRVSAR